MTHSPQSDDLEAGKFDLQEMLAEIESESADRTQTDVKQSEILKMFRKTGDEREPKP